MCLTRVESGLCNCASEDSRTPAVRVSHFFFMPRQQSAVSRLFDLVLLTHLVVFAKTGT